MVLLLFGLESDAYFVLTVLVCLMLQLDPSLDRSDEKKKYIIRCYERQMMPNFSVFSAQWITMYRVQTRMSKHK